MQTSERKAFQTKRIASVKILCIEFLAYLRSLVGEVLGKDWFKEEKLGDSV